MTRWGLTGDLKRAFLEKNQAEPVTQLRHMEEGSELLVYYPRNNRKDYHSDKTTNPGWLRYHNISSLLARFFITAHFNHGKVKNWRDNCIGTISIYKGNGESHVERTHLPMLDYDGKNIKTRVKKAVKKLQATYGLGDATLYLTRNGLHVYFFSDKVTWSTYEEMLTASGCCEGFAKSTKEKQYAVLRVSAKYTDFDIFPYTVIKSPKPTKHRPGKKALIIQEILRQGQGCGTHFATLYPQWANFQEDSIPWSVPRNVARAAGRKRVKKVSAKHLYSWAKETIERGNTPGKTTIHDEVDVSADEAAAHEIAAKLDYYHEKFPTTTSSVSGSTTYSVSGNTIPRYYYNDYAK
jgi:hypothetical protein